MKHGSIYDRNEVLHKFFNVKQKKKSIYSDSVYILYILNKPMRRQLNAKKKHVHNCKLIYSHTYSIKSIEQLLHILIHIDPQFMRHKMMNTIFVRHSRQKLQFKKKSAFLNLHKLLQPEMREALHWGWSVKRARRSKLLKCKENRNVLAEKVHFRAVKMPWKYFAAYCKLLKSTENVARSISQIKMLHKLCPSA